MDEHAAARPGANVVATAAREPALDWQWATFAELTLHELYAVLQLRQRVFIVEQTCPFLDADGRDADALHLLGWTTPHAGDAPDAGGEGPTRALFAYARVFAPGVRYPLPSIGRVVTAPEARRGGYGRALMREAIMRVEAMAPAAMIRIEAQLYLERFYGDFGFRRSSEVYDEDGIPHILMERDAQACP